MHLLEDLDILKIFILAGGFGTRLQSVVSDVPKPMAPILNKPFLDYQIKEIRRYFPNNEIYLLTYYMSDIIENYYKNNSLIRIIKEDKPLGTGGSIKNAIKHLDLDLKTQLLVLNGDTFIKPDLSSFTKNKEISILASFQQDCSRYGALNIKNNKLIEFKEKDKNCTDSYVNAGCYYFNDLTFFKSITSKEFSIEDKFKQYLDANGTILSYKYNDIFIDIGIAEDYAKMIDYIGEICE
jgi:D-glycero-alpha-D-manno-heptose 1-phosphate guanylyltransferase